MQAENRLKSVRFVGQRFAGILMHHALLLQHVPEGEQRVNFIKHGGFRRKAAAISPLLDVAFDRTSTPVAYTATIRWRKSSDHGFMLKSPDV